MDGTLTFSVNLGGSSLWSPFKDLYSVIYNAIFKKNAEAIPDLEAALRKHKPNFISLLRNPPKNIASREAVKKASTDGIAVLGQIGPQILSQTLVDESLIVSDMFELNELNSLELLVAGQQEQPHFPGLTRGLVAVLLYYDGRRTLVNSLRALIQARKGRTWTLGLSGELTSIINRYTDQLKEENIVSKVIGLIEEIDLAKELHLLQKNRALAGPRYRKQVVDLIQEIRQSLAEIVFCWACQGMLSSSEAQRILIHLSKQGIGGDGSLDSVTLTLLMALLYVIDVSVLQSCEDSDDIIQSLPVVADREIIPVLHKELFSSERNWQIPGLKAVVQFAWAVTLRTLSQFPLQSFEEFNQFMEQDERSIDTAIENNAFDSLHQLVVTSSNFRQEEFFLKRIHTLITDFIVLMPLKIKELRNRGDETARIINAHAQEGILPPTNLSRHLEHLMKVIGDMYKDDPLNLELALEYWCPTEISADQSYPYRPPQKQVSLYKFIRLAGDLLPAPLFVPYVDMLTGLSGSKLTAHHCYTLLKANGKNASGQCSIVSWDHIFASFHLYYNGLKMEVPAPSLQYTYRQHSSNRGITPQEVEGLISALRLMETVVLKDEMARTSLWENSQYAPSNVLLGLVGCSVPPELKASLLCTLSAFAHSSIIASNLWQCLENFQIIPTVKTSLAYQPGIHTELEEVEARNEEFPITRAMLKLLNILLDHPLPTSLGIGQHIPAFVPYLEYVIDAVFLHFNTRAYKREEEKWEVAKSCLQIFVKLLQRYQRIPDINMEGMYELSTVGRTGSMSLGYILMSQLLKEGGLLRMVMYILDEGWCLLGMYMMTPRQKELERCTLLCLKLLQEALICQTIFLQQVREGSTAIVVSNLDQLLMGINPRHGHADYLVIVGKYVSLNAFLPEHALAAIRILRHACANSSVAKHLAAAFSSNQNETDTLLHGFVECLDTNILELFDESSLEGTSSARIYSDICEELLSFLLTCLKHPVPNVAHFLLGFQPKRPVSEVTLQDPGVLGSPRTCLHSVLTMLDRGLDLYNYPICIEESPYVAELAYQLIYTLCANKDTSGPTLRYLRTMYDFLYRHLRFLPYKIKHGDHIKALSSQSWLLKTVAIELRVTAAHNQRSHVQRLLNVLLNDSPASSGVDVTETPISQNASFPAIVQSISEPMKRKLMQILDSLEFEQVCQPLPEWEYFDNVEIQHLLKACELSRKDGPHQISISEVQKRLTDEILALQGASAVGQRAMITREIRSILHYAKLWNNARKEIYIKAQAFEAWRLVTEVLLTVCPLEMLESEQKHQVILEVSQELLQRVLVDDALTELTSSASGVILMLMATLHHNLRTSVVTAHSNIYSAARLEATGASIIPTSSQHTALVVVLKRITECLLRTGGGHQRVRINYYGALLNLLGTVRHSSDVFTTFGMGRIETAVLEQESESEKMSREYTEAILGFGDQIMEVVCRDASNGHDVTKMLAFSLLDVVISLDRQHKWLDFLISKGYLRHFVDSLLKDDDELQNILTRGSSSLRSVYVFESKLSLFTRIGNSSAGAQALARNGIIDRLTECESLDLRPEVLRDWQGSAVVKETSSWLQPDLFHLYQQILMPALRVVLSTSPKYLQGEQQLLNFVAAHSGIFSDILRDRQALGHLDSLAELSLVTAVLSQAALSETMDEYKIGMAYFERQGQIAALRHHLLALLPLLVSHNWQVGQFKTMLDEPIDSITLKLRMLELAANVLSSCRTIISGDSSRILFTSNLADALSSSQNYMFDKESYSVPTSQRPPGIGLLIALIHQCSCQLQAVSDTYKNLQQRLGTLPNMCTEELTEFLPLRMKINPPSAPQKKDLIYQNLNQLSGLHGQMMSILYYIIEVTVYLLWHHLQHFFVYSTRDDMARLGHKWQHGSLKMHDSLLSPLSKKKIDLAENWLNQSDVDTLKADITNIMNDSFFNKLQLVQQCFTEGPSHLGFLEAFVRRLKRLIWQYT